MCFGACTLLQSPEFCLRGNEEKFVAGGAGPLMIFAALHFELLAQDCFVGVIFSPLRFLSIISLPRDKPVSKTARDSGSVSAQITPVMCRLILAAAPSAN